MFILFLLIEMFEKTNSLQFVNRQYNFNWCSVFIFIKILVLFENMKLNLSRHSLTCSLIYQFVHCFNVYILHETLIGLYISHLFKNVNIFLFFHICFFFFIFSHRTVAMEWTTKKHYHRHYSTIQVGINLHVFL